MFGHALVDYFGSLPALSYIKKDTNRYEYYQAHHEFRSLRQLSRRIKSVFDYSEIKTINSVFEPLGQNLGVAKAVTRRNLGKANYEILNGQGINRQIIFYRQRLGKISLLSQLHFYKDTLIYVKSSFDYLSYGNELRQKVLLTIAEKYNIDLIEMSKIESVFADIESNRMRISDNGRINIEYFFGDDFLVKDLDLKANLANHRRKESIVYQADLISAMV